MATEITLNLPFAVTAQGRQRNTAIIDKRSGLIRSWNYMPQKSKEMQSLVRSFAQSHMRRNGIKPIEGAYELYFKVTMVPARSWSKKKRSDALSGKLKHKTKPDRDNLDKLIGDALNGVCYIDDKLNWDAHSRKVYGHEESTIIKIIETTDDWVDPLGDFWDKA